MRREILEVTCDECGLIARFETFCNGVDGLTFTNHPLAMLTLQGWQQRPYGAGRSFRYTDHCPTCARGRIENNTRIRKMDQATRLK